MKKAVVNIARLVLAVTLILSGFVKAVDPLGTQYKIQDYLTAMGLGGIVPDLLTLSTSVLLSGLEFILGICLLFAIRRRFVSKVVLVMMVPMTMLTLWLAIADPIHDCGCFGMALAPAHTKTHRRVEPVDCVQLFQFVHPAGGGPQKPLHPAPVRLPSLLHRG